MQAPTAAKKMKLQKGMHVIAPEKGEKENRETLHKGNIKLQRQRGQQQPLQE